MMQQHCEVRGVREVGENIHVLSFVSPTISDAVLPGQFVNIKVGWGTDPLLRRPFSVYSTDGDRVEVIFNVIGRGTKALYQKRGGDILEVLGPLGTPYSFDKQDFSTALLIGGGLGVAPLPLLTRALRRAGKQVVTFLGARSASQVVDHQLEAVHVATDDGSKGYHGNVVDMFESAIKQREFKDVRVFACGPTAMLRALSRVTSTSGLRCELSLEGAMACGFGICQGCPVELLNENRKYALMCKEGPVFDAARVRL